MNLRPRLIPDRKFARSPRAEDTTDGLLRRDRGISGKSKRRR